MSLSSGIQLAKPGEVQEHETPDWMLNKPVPIDLLVDTQCRPRHERGRRAHELLHMVCKVLMHAGQMEPYQISQTLSGVASQWTKVSSGDSDV